MLMSSFLLLWPWYYDVTQYKRVPKSILIPNGCCDDDDDSDEDNEEEGGDTETKLWYIFAFFFKSVYSHKLKGGFQGFSWILTVVMLHFHFLVWKQKQWQCFFACSGTVTLTGVGLFLILLCDDQDIGWLSFEILKFWLEMFLFYRFTFTITF